MALPFTILRRLGNPFAEKRGQQQQVEVDSLLTKLWDIGPVADSWSDGSIAHEGVQDAVPPLPKECTAPDLSLDLSINRNFEGEDVRTDLSMPNINSRSILGQHEEAIAAEGDGRLQVESGQLGKTAPSTFSNEMTALPAQPGISRDGRVFRSSDNMLYLIGGSNGAAPLHTAEGFANSVDHHSWASLISSRKDSFAAIGVRFIQLIVPEKLAIYPLNLVDLPSIFPGAALADVVGPGRRLLNALNEPAISYPDDFLRAQREVHPIYPRTDSHWTWQGAFSAFQDLMWRVGYQPDYYRFVNFPTYVIKYHGDLWEGDYLDIEPESFTRVRVPKNLKRIYANPIVGYKEAGGLEDKPELHTGSHCIFHNCEAQFKEVVILFGSSFSESRPETSLLTAIFATYFETVHFIWSTSVDHEYALRNKANLVVAEIPERFLTSCPTDDTVVEEHGLSRLRSWKTKTT